MHTFAAAGTYEVRLKATTSAEEATTVLRVRVRSPAIVLARSAQPLAPAAGEEGATLSFRVDQRRAGAHLHLGLRRRQRPRDGRHRLARLGG